MVANVQNDYFRGFNVLRFYDSNNTWLHKMQDLSYTYNESRDMYEPGSSSVNTSSKRGPLGGSHETRNEYIQGERHHLLNLTDSEINDSAEDLRLPMPSTGGSNGGGILAQGKSFKTSAGVITNGVSSAAGRIRRKIRLKR